MSNQMIVFASVMAAILMTGLLALNPSTITNANAQMYANDYGYDNSYYPEPKSSHTDIQKIKCVNSNINVNGIDITQIPQDNTVAVAASNEGANTENGNGLTDRINFERNLVNICVNVNDNEQIKISQEEPTCESCFRDNLDPQTFAALLLELEEEQVTLQEFCQGLADPNTTNQIKLLSLLQLFSGAGISQADRLSILQCLEGLGLIVLPT